jgi:hypothetical protein
MEDERSVRGVIRGAGACSALAGREERVCSKILQNLAIAWHRPLPLLPPSTSGQSGYCSMQVDKRGVRVLERLV